jgi:cytoskeletal protein RodZ
MALSADEQRALAEIERRLASDDPGLASCLTAFRRPGPGRVLRSPRARIIGSLFTVLLVAMVSLMVYAMIPFRTHGARTVTPAASTPNSVSIAATGTSIQPRSAPPASARASASGPATAKSSAKSATPSAGQSAGTSQAQATGSQAADQVASPATSP